MEDGNYECVLYIVTIRVESHDCGVLPVHAPVQTPVAGVLEAEPLHPDRVHICHHHHHHHHHRHHHHYHHHHLHHHQHHHHIYSVDDAAG